MKFFNLIVFSLLVYNLVLASPIKKKCYVKNKKNTSENSENSENSEISENMN